MAKKITTYKELISSIKDGVFHSANKFRHLSRSLIIYKLDLDENHGELRYALNEEINRLASEGNYQAKGRLESFRKIAAGKPVNWNAIDEAAKALGKDSDVDHLGHKEISNLRIHARELAEHWPVTKRPKDFDIIMRKYQAVIQLLDNLDHRLSIQLGDYTKSGDRLEAFIKHLNNQNNSVDIKVTSNLALLSNELNNSINIAIEDADENLAKGGVSHALGFLIKDYLTGPESKKNRLREVLDRVSVDIHGSPKITDDIGDIIDSLFFTGKVKPVKRRKRFGSRSKHKSANIKVKKRKKYPKAGIRSRVRTPDLGISIQAILNEVLPEYVKDQMGDPEDPPIKLRNQSGRFAESVQAIGVTSTRSGAVNVIYSIMLNPYGTFLPGGKLYTPERDPSAIIPVAIREATTQLIGRKLRINAELAG